MYMTEMGGVDQKSERATYESVLLAASRTY